MSFPSLKDQQPPLTDVTKCVHIEIQIIYQGVVSYSSQYHYHNIREQRKRDNKGEHRFEYGYGLDVEKGPNSHAFEVNTT